MPSLRARLINNFILPLRGLRKLMSSEESMARRYASFRPEAALPPRHLGRSYRIQRHTAGSMTTFEMTPLRDGSGLHLLYLHGGGYVNELLRPHWSIVEGLAKRTGATVHIPLYPLAPRNTWAEAFPPVRGYAVELMKRTPNVAFVGDSAGGGFALALAQLLRDERAALPRGIVLFSPWLDISVNDSRQPELAQEDRMLAVPGLQWAGRQWRGQLAADDPRVSPLYGSLQGLPSVAVFTGTADLLHTDALRLREKAEAAGHSMTYHERTGLFHVWVGAPIPEANEALDAAARFLTSASN